MIDSIANVFLSMQFVVTIYSPISHKRTQWFRIPVIYDGYEVADGDGKMVSIQACPITSLSIQRHRR